MAQTLKESVRQRILKAAEDQMYTQGPAVTMRQIAKAAGVTAGNLYRYYAGREELLTAVTKPVMDGLEELVIRHTNARLTLGQSGFELPPALNPQQLRTEMYSCLVPALQDLCTLAAQYPRPMAILCQQSEMNQALMDWFYGLMQGVLDQLFHMQPQDLPVVELMVRTEGHAFCQGVMVLMQYPQTLPQVQQQAIQAFLSIQIEGILSLIQEMIRSGKLQSKGDVTQ